MRQREGTVAPEPGTAQSLILSRGLWERKGQADNPGTTGILGWEVGEEAQSPTEPHLVNGAVGAAPALGPAVLQGHVVQEPCIFPVTLDPLGHPFSHALQQPELGLLHLLHCPMALGAAQL